MKITDKMIDEIFESMSKPSIESELKKIAQKLTHIICKVEDPAIRKTIQIARDHIEATYINNERKGKTDERPGKRGK